MTYPCDTCHHKIVCKHSEEMKVFIEDLEKAIKDVADRHKNLKISDILSVDEHVCKTYLSGKTYV